MVCLQGDLIIATRVVCFKRIKQLRQARIGHKVKAEQEEMPHDLTDFGNTLKPASSKGRSFSRHKATQ